MYLKKYCFFILNLITLFSNANNTLEILKLVKNFIPSNPIIIEAGAHHGEDTVIMSKFWPSGTIHAFEPLSNSFNIMLNSTKKFRNIKQYKFALSDKNGEAEFWICTTNHGASSLLKPNQIKPELNLYPIGPFEKKPIYVQCLTLDKWAEQYQIKNVDFMWLDMEGYELFVLQASPKILKTIKAIYTEVNCLEFRKDNPLYHEVKNWLKNEGFVEIWKDVNPKWQGNVLFVRK